MITLCGFHSSRFWGLCWYSSLFFTLWAKIVHWIVFRNHSHIDIWVQPACFLRHNGISRIHRVARSIKLQVHYLRSAHVDGKEQWFSTLFDLQHPSFLIEPFGGTPVENHWYSNLAEWPLVVCTSNFGLVHSDAKPSSLVLILVFLATLSSILFYEQIQI